MLSQKLNREQYNAVKEPFLVDKIVETFKQ